MKILICPDKFKGSATANEVATAIEKGVRRNHPDAAVQKLPIADGGEGFSAVAAEVLDGKWVRCKTVDALYRSMEAEYYVSNNTAYIDMSAACGIDKLKTSEYNPWLTSTQGTGMMMRHAMEAGVDKIIVGLGGSATNDGGAGMAHELGYRFLDIHGAELEPTPAELIHCVKITNTNIVKLPEIIAACDVSNLLLGEQGASAIYGPQKGLLDVSAMDAVLQNLTIVGNGAEAADTAGSGAAGGLAFALMHYANAELKSGFELVSEMIDLETHIKKSDVVITGEGSLDAQTLNGKGPHGVALLAGKYSKPVYAVAGRVEDCARKCFTQVETLMEQGHSLEECMDNAVALIEQVSASLNIGV